LWVERTYHVYVLASRSRNLYVGMTNDLERRLAQHRSGKGSVFAQKYRLRRLVHCEPFSTAREAIAREKQIKAWRRSKKVALIEENNPTWSDLGGTLFGWEVKEQQVPRLSVRLGRTMARDD
jgi:putative endonuclease